MASSVQIRLRAGLSSCLRSFQVRPPVWRGRWAQNASQWANNTNNCGYSTASSLTKVEKLVLDTIKGSATSSATGPMSFSTYMKMCLAHPTEGYYSNPSNPIFGAKGDFITSPEISQVFGELLAVWMLSQWLNSGNAKPIRLVELGPGRGTLMADILRVLAQFPAARAAVSDILLVENSDTLKTTQAETLRPLAEKNEWNLSWTSHIEEVEATDKQYTMVVAHEFFDALPFHLLQATDGWREVLITSGPDPTSPTKLGASTHPLDNPSPGTVKNLSSTNFRTVLSPTSTATANLLGVSSPRFQKIPVGGRLEVSPTSFKIARRIGELLHSDSTGTGAAGCALIIDYGGAKSYGSSFRAFKGHKIVDVFHRPGECDLTINVDFAYLKDAIADLAMTLGPLPQGMFLTRMGLRLRVEALKKVAKSEKRKTDIENAAKRLVDATGMGSQYQVLAISGTGKAELSPEQRWPFVDQQQLQNTNVRN
ncbi:S-adenosyl-L-methionine-dependent methyltransferase [Irpex rosettiformis]|uniref:S-adenosyl-L-methionine-dependent methyltransferase n=1 Tax=Irpex rosettiformis TaxID=378272 RepID=A0ACB8U9P3_9APHY|nr:S-adenosyl-L-methionine-dependent methyltransferase [Irpex rosettiformis]